MKLQRLLLPALVLGAAVLLTFPEPSQGFSTLGHQLATTQTDFRVYNNFADPEANDNTTQHPQFPGWDGAELAIWKGCIEWASDPHGDGSGDPLQSELGSGTSNFDPMFTGAATSPGTVGGNVHSALNQVNAGVLAFMSGGASGWWCRYYDGWTWYDGPGNDGYPDLQAVATHEYGHALGLGHSSSSSATMYASGGSTGARSISADDQQGIRAIYLHRDNSGIKPRIFSAVKSGGKIHLVCENLTLNQNQVWFTRKNANTGVEPGDPIKVTGLVSTNGNTELSASIPQGAGPGDVIVKAGTFGHAGTSAPFPFDPGSPPVPLAKITSSSTGTVEALTPLGGATFSVFGSSFTNVFEVRVDDELLGDGSSFDGSYTIVDDTRIDIVMPLAENAGLVDVTVSGPFGSDEIQVDIVAPSNPALAIDQPNVVSSVGLDIAVSAQVGDVVFLLFSPLLGPTVIPGVLDWEIGNGNVNLIFNVKGWTIGTKLWRKQTFGPFTGLSPGEMLHFEGWVLELANGYQAPWGSTNAVTRTVIL